MTNIPSDLTDEPRKQLPKPPAEIYVPSLDMARSCQEKELYLRQRVQAVAHAIKTWYDSAQLETLGEFEDLAAWDVIITVKDGSVEHSIVEDNNDGHLRIRYINEDGTETTNMTPADEIEVPEWTEIFVIKWGDNT